MTRPAKDLALLKASLAEAQLEKDQYKSSLFELQKILDLCRVISSSQDLKDILHHLLFLLSEILPSRGCAVFVGGTGNSSLEISIGSAPILTSNFTPALKQVLVQHFEEGIIRWILNERRVCLIPSFEDGNTGPGSQGDFAVIPLNDNDKNYGFIWIACTIKQEELTPDTSKLIWVLSSHASIAILNCLHRQAMEQQINELKLLSSINGIKSQALHQGGLPAFFREFQRFITHELNLKGSYLILDGLDIAEKPLPLPCLDGAPFLQHAETRKLFRLADKEMARLELGEFFHSAYPHVAKAFESYGLAILSLSPPDGLPAYLFLKLTEENMQRIPLLHNLLLAAASQARMMAENIGLYDSLLTANRNLTALQWQLVNSGKMAALGQLAGGVAHEINNPLQIMLGRIQMIQLMSQEKKGLEDDTPAAKEKVKNELNLVTEEILRIRDIVRNLLDFSRQGTRETAFTTVSINETVNEVIALLHHQFISSKVEIKVNLSSENHLVLGNKNQLKQVFMNLMINAIHAMENEPRMLNIDTRQNGDKVETLVRDTGMGIPQEHLQRIFEPFYTTKTKGTGLGLSISYGLIKEHKGAIEVESKEAEGTCFIVQLPKMSPEGIGYNLIVG
jgi:signal transduction histidine kinase